MLRYILSALLLLSLVILPSCGGPGSGFSLPGTIVDDDDDNEPTYFGTVLLRGSVRAVDRDTGLELTDEEYDDRAGGMLLYVLEDPADLSSPLDKFTFDSPSEFTTEIDAGFGDVYVLVVVDNGDHIINGADMTREYPNNPVEVLGTDIFDIDVIIDLPAPSGGGPGGPGGVGDGTYEPTTVLGGNVYLSEAEFGDLFLLGSIGDVLVTSHSTDFAHGPWSWDIRNGAGPFQLTVQDRHQEAALIAYFDADDNGFFEPSDPLGAPVDNSFELGNGMVGDIEISIPSDAAETPISFPPSYVTLYGEVEWSDYATGDILVFATTATYYGAVLDQMVLGSPGSFSLRVPPSTSSILVWAIADEDGDGSFDIGDDPSGAADLVSTNENDIYDVEVQITDSPPPATISGAVRWDGPVGPTDQVWIVLLADEDGEPNPVFFEGISAPVFPQPFSFDVPPGTWYPSCYLDIGGDNAGEPQPNEPTYTGSAITVVPGQSVPGVQLWLALDGEE